MVQMIPIMIVGATVHVLAKVNVTKTVTAKVVANEKYYTTHKRYAWWTK